MGAVSFSLDLTLVECLKSALPLSWFIETGTFKGDTIATMLPYFDCLISIELSKSLWKESSERFKNEECVQILQGDSGDMMLDLTASTKNQSTLYWLDAHWCVATNTTGEQSQCPLLREIQGIGTLGEQSVILIDDARLFLAIPPAPHDSNQWPTFAQLISALNSISQQHEIMVVNDVIVFYPLSARSVISQYAKKYGIDWLRASQSLNENTFLRNSLEDKECVIRELTAAQQLAQVLPNYYQLMETKLQEKELVIQKQSAIIQTYKKAFLFYSLIMRPIIAFIKIIRPRIGNLNQYSPRPLSSLKKFHSKKPESLLKISIVTPSFSQGNYIEKTINSILDQGYSHLEYFIQDGGSLDNTVEVLKRYDDKLSGWISKPDKGQSEAINLGFSQTTGDIMGWINSDDILLPGALACIADYFTRHPEIDVVYGNRLLIDENDMEIGRWILPGHISKALSWADYIPQETLFWRRRIWDKVDGRIDESFRFAMDWDLLVRFREAGARFAHIPRFLGAFRIHEHQKTTAVINEIGFKEMDRIRERTLGRVPSRKEIHKAILPFMLRHLVVDMAFRVKKRLKRSL